ncbi:MAG: manganese efflux pump MntP family protein [Eubacterium sp.]|nr:manganese efflux pump MntP family protein [Eubacterium sp.]
MSFGEIVLLAVGLSMDAFAVSACIGLTLSKATIKKSLTAGLYFGVFQAGMPLIGYFVARLFADKIIAFDHWIAFGLLVFLGVKMIVESFKNEGFSEEKASLKPSQMLPLAVATSIDALAVGVSLAFAGASIAPAVSIIGITTLIISMIGVKIGNAFGTKFKAQAEIAGGVILILIGVKILIDSYIQFFMAQTSAA